MFLAIAEVHPADGVCGICDDFQVVGAIPYYEDKVDGPSLNPRYGLFAKNTGGEVGFFNDPFARGYIAADIGKDLGTHACSHNAEPRVAGEELASTAIYSASAGCPQDLFEVPNRMGMAIRFADERWFGGLHTGGHKASEPERTLGRALERAFTKRLADEVLCADRCWMSAIVNVRTRPKPVQ